MPQNQSPPPDRAPPKLALSSGPYPGAMPLQDWARELPLQGVTILAVEDSRFACEALRLMARRAGYSPLYRYSISKSSITCTTIH